MLVLVGPRAFSKFRLESINRSVDVLQNGLRLDDAYFFYLVNLSSAPDKEEVKNLCSLLQASGNLYPIKKDSESNLIFVLPRKGTVSPWSSKATEIAKLCGFERVLRIERGIYYRSSSPLSDQSKAFIFDKMTEQVLEASEIDSYFEKPPRRSIQILELNKIGRSAIEDLNETIGLSLDTTDIERLENFYLEEGRDPTDAEIVMFAQINSEHCRHKIFNSKLSLGDGNNAPSMMQLIRNTKEAMKGEGVLSAYKDNAAIIKGSVGARFYTDFQTGEYKLAKEEINIAIKVETHNHPTAISPFQGAATGSGGEIRDEAAVGRGARPKAGMTGFSLSNLRIPSQILPWEIDYGHPSRISSALEIILEAPIGAAAFNNEFGRPNIAGYLRTFESYIGEVVRGYHKPIMVAGGFGNVRSDQVNKRKFNPGDLIVLLGGPSMLIGLGGGGASSSVGSEKSKELDFSSVQRSNPEMQRRCQEVIDCCWQMGKRNPILSIHDVGAGGLSNAVPEILHDSEVGGKIDLRSIPTDDHSLSPMEIWCNEAQERYVVAIAQSDLAVFKRFCLRERCPFAVIGEATLNRQLLVFDDYSESPAVSLPLSFLLGSTKKFFEISKKKEKFIRGISKKTNFREALDRVLKNPTVASKKYLITIGDRTVGGLVARDQMIGPWQVPVADVGVTATDFEGIAGEAISIGERAPVSIISSRASVRLSIGEAITNIAAAKINGLSKVKISANWMAAADFEDDKRDLYNAVEDLGLNLCPELQICIPVGKDSLSMQTDWLSHSGTHKSVVSPVTLIATAFAPVVDVRETLTPELSVISANTRLIFIDLANGKQRLGGSILAQCYQELGSEAPDLENPKQLNSFFRFMQQHRSSILAYHDRSDGGLLITLLEMAFAARAGIEITLPEEVLDPIQFLFNEELGAVVQVRQDFVAAVLKELESLNIPGRVIGIPNTKNSICINYRDNRFFSCARSELEREWNLTGFYLQSLRDNPETAREEFDLLENEKDRGLFAECLFNVEEDICAKFLKNHRRPRVAILREQGTNSQLEMAAAFYSAGFSPVDVHMTQLQKREIDLKDFQGLAVSGGFSFGDTFGAGRAWAKSILYDPHLREVFEKFFANEDTFSLGVCNGCQMMEGLRTIIPGSGDWPTFLRNKSEQFEARISMVQIQKTESIFLKGMEGSSLPIVVSHGEGRAEASAAKIDSLELNNRIAMKYVDSDLSVTEHYPQNPNGSQNGVSAVVGAGGRVLAMMPHPERSFRAFQHTWSGSQWKGEAPWLRLFKNARVWLG